MGKLGEPFPVGVCMHEVPPENEHRRRVRGNEESEENTGCSLQCPEPVALLRRMPAQEPASADQLHREKGDQNRLYVVVSVNEAQNLHDGNMSVATENAGSVIDQMSGKEKQHDPER